MPCRRVSARPGEGVIRFLDHLAVPRSVYDGIVTSGDVTRAVVQQRTGQSLFLIGPVAIFLYVIAGLVAPDAA